MKYKALFLDVDDTLISSSKTVSQVNLDAIERARAAGVFVTVSTGRPYLGVKPLAKTLGIQGPIVVFGGSMCVDTRTDETIFVEKIDSALITQALYFARECGVHAHIYQENDVVAYAANEFTDYYTSHMSLPFRTDEKFFERTWDNVPKVLIYVNPDRHEEYMQLFAKKFEDQLHVSMSKPGFIELNSKGHNKGSALLRVAELMNIPREATVAAGDNTLDLQMIIEAGLGACVENGNPIVKAAADIIIPSADDNGVATLIEKYIL